MANEAGAGAVDRAASAGDYTFVSKGAPASIGGSVQKLEVYAQTGEITSDIKFGFFTASGNTLTPVAGSQVTITDFKSTGPAVQTFVAGVDFTAFNVSAGDYLGCWVPMVGGTSQDYGTSGGGGVWYLDGDYIAAGGDFNLGSSWLDALSADISAAAGVAPTGGLYGSLVGPFGGPMGPMGGRL